MTLVVTVADGAQRRELVLDSGAEALRSGEQPVAFVVDVVCQACRAVLAARAAVDFAWVDDDHFGYRDTGFVGRAAFPCACGAHLVVELPFTVTLQRGDDSRSIAQDALPHLVGAALADRAR